MRGFIVGLLVLAGTASAQDSLYFTFGRDIVAPWGSSKSVVMAMAKHAGLTFNEINNIESNGILHITYDDNNVKGVHIQRMFTFFSGQYVGHTWVIISDLAIRHKIIAKHQEYCMLMGEPSPEIHKFKVTIEGTLYEINAKNSKDSGMLMVVNRNAVEQAVKD
jgi:hypothetical protein